MRNRNTRGELEVESLLKIVLALVAVLLVLQIVGALISSVASLLGPFFFVVQLAIAVLIVLWLVDRL
ncbi:hypothetical protein OB955_05070 [Halobacteria archaeon AArc-m2/3/4]|uniref:Uncharacterized protein n=1 Tax=Natronoglomus mannanivorans TaxID=2979990 RepID=A0AAP3E454_9EURY|nr:hypothetical protein [Halobacteria archaeon AArc-xg1-1]MCU4972103.1 hypothetical protein [Halobacteria archaeon AArc-m2/3/4]